MVYRVFASAPNRLYNKMQQIHLEKGINRMERRKGALNMHVLGTEPRFVCDRNKHLRPVLGIDRNFRH